jgi:hypothetical protein
MWERELMQGHEFISRGALTKGLDLSTTVRGRVRPTLPPTHAMPILCFPIIQG